MSACDLDSDGLQWQACANGADARVVYRDVTVEFPTSLQSWENAFSLSATLDGYDISGYPDSVECASQRRPGRLSTEHTLRIAAVCDDPMDNNLPSNALMRYGVVPGDHTLVITGVIPGTSVSWESDPVTISLTCPAATVGGDMGSSGEPSPDAGSQRARMVMRAARTLLAARRAPPGC